MKKRGIVTVIAVAAALLAGRGALIASRALGSQQKPIPTVRVERGNVQLDVFTAGELRAPNSSSVVAPQVNGTLQIVSMVSTGAKVKKGDVLVEFDPGEQEYNYSQAESQFHQAEQDILKATSDAQVQASQDELDLIKARFDVRRAELEVEKNELVSTIDAQKNDLALAEAKRKLAQLEQDVKSRAASGDAGIKVLEETRNAAKLQMQVAQKSIEDMTVKSGLDGLVSVKENRDATGGFFMPGMVLPEYHAGDLVQSGRFLAEVLDVGQMEVQAKVSESDRANIAPDQAAEVLIDAHPHIVLPAKVKTIASQVSRDPWSNDSSGKFQARFQLEGNSPELRPGVSAMVKVHGVLLSDVLSVPTQSVFDKDGKQVVYVKHGSGFDETAVRIKYRTEARVVVEGLSEGTEVAVINPAKKEKSGNRPTSAIAGGLR
jgi:HlyD family secretion protein